MTAAVFLWGLLEDPTFRAVHDALCALGADVVVLNHAAVDRVDARFSSSPAPRHELSHDGRTWLLEDFSAAYLRPYDWRDYGLGSPAIAAARAVAAHHVVGDWAEQTTATVINRPSAEGSNRAKLLQALHARASGFSTPESLVTSDRERILKFHRRHGSIVCKSASNVRSVVRAVTPDELKAADIGPTLVQQRVRGTQVRVHVIGERTVACMIESEEIDYRYAADAVLTPCDLPADVALRCVDLARRLGLVLAGLDLIVSPSGDWFCLEANPNPGFSYYDASGDSLVARAVAQALAAPTLPKPASRR